jgi:hypothetical protein
VAEESAPGAALDLASAVLLEGIKVRYLVVSVRRKPKGTLSDMFCFVPTGSWTTGEGERLARSIGKAVIGYRAD